jgi:hypothetical protein
MTAKSKAAKGAQLETAEVEALLATLQERFEGHMHRHPGIAWDAVRTRLEERPDKLWSLRQMEATGGEPDVVGEDPDTGNILFADCSPESPAGRRSLCYDAEALASRKKHKPESSATERAAAMGATLLDEGAYRKLQELEPFDSKTSSWLLTPTEIRERGGAIFGDFRFGRVFIYHNGAESYYGARGFRCTLRV